MQDFEIDLKSFEHDVAAYHVLGIAKAGSSSGIAFSRVAACQDASEQRARRLVCFIMQSIIMKGCRDMIFNFVNLRLWL